MPNFDESLQGRDLGHLRIIAKFWGVELSEQDTRSALPHLTASILTSERLEKLEESLTPGEKEALGDLIRHSGRLPWAQFTRIYGELREMGIARRDRDQPYKQPISAVESLWYKGLVARTFFDTPSGPEEYAYIPDDLLVKVSLETEQEPPVMGQQAANAEYARNFAANDRILDHACTLLAALRMNYSLPDPFIMQPAESLTPTILKSLLSAAGLLDQAGVPLSEPVRIFLEAPRGQALASLVRSWEESPIFNELRMLPNLSFEGKWKNDPLEARQVVLSYLSSIRPGTWWDLDSFISAIKKRNPDFQRPAGDYDSWFIRDTRSDEYLHGFETWDEVDGRLIRFIITGPLHWLGVLDLGCAESGQEVHAFRLSGWATQLLKGEAPKGMQAEKEPLIIRSDAYLSARRLVPRHVRYQISRFCDWREETVDGYQYQITSASLSQARKQGLKISHLLSLLNHYSKAVPPSLIKALERWDQNGSEARMEKMVVLRVASAEVLQALQKSRAGRFLGEPLGATMIRVKPGAAAKVLAALAELGYLGEIRGDIDD